MIITTTRIQITELIPLSVLSTFSLDASCSALSEGAAVTAASSVGAIVSLGSGVGVPVSVGSGVGVLVSVGSGVGVLESVENTLRTGRVCHFVEQRPIERLSRFELFLFRHNDFIVRD